MTDDQVNRQFNCGECRAVADATPAVSVQELGLRIYQGGLAQGCHQNTIARNLLAHYDIRQQATHA